jgi:Sigma-70 region 2
MTDEDGATCRWPRGTGWLSGSRHYRTHQKAVAYRMLGSLSEADDAVQEAWVRLSRSDTIELARDKSRASGVRPLAVHRPSA